MAKLNKVEAAHKYALRGEMDAAERELTALQAEGNVGAHASLAEIAAYRGRWADVLKLVEVVFGTPSALRTMNVYTDMAGLTALAGSELGNWAEIGRLATFARSKLKKGSTAGYAETLKRLAAFAESRGKQPLRPRNERKAAFESALEAAAKEKFANVGERLDHVFALARVYDYYDGAVALYDKEKKKLPNIFDNAVFAASGLARSGREKDAWQVIESILPRWWPVELTQVAPVILLTDEGLRPLMTPKRCEQILSTPRGPEAGK